MSAPDEHFYEDFDRMPDLPRETERRWTVRRKAAIVEGVRGGWLPIEEACRLYMISVDEFIAWERDIDRFGMHGLRTTRYQIYRETAGRGGHKMKRALRPSCVRGSSGAPSKKPAL